MSAVSKTNFMEQWNSICDEFSLKGRLPISHDGTSLPEWQNEEFSRNYTTIFKYEFASDIEKVIDIFKRYLKDYIPGTLIEIRVIAIEKAVEGHLPKAHPLVQFRYGTGLANPFSIVSKKNGLKVVRRTFFYLEKQDFPSFEFHRFFFCYANQGFDKSLLKRPTYQHLKHYDPEQSEVLQKHAFWHLISNHLTMHNKLADEFHPEKSSIDPT